MKKATGNHKHLTLDQRIIIEHGLHACKSFAEIAREIGKNAGTISKEIRRHTKKVPGKGTSFQPTPCANRPECKVHHLCSKLCNRLCKACPRYGFKCIEHCSKYRQMECNRLLKPPYVCNGCSKKGYCLSDRVIYSAKYADDCYRETLSSCREGINQTPESIQRLDNLVSPLIKKGQSLSHIYGTHAEQIGCCRRTLYNYIDKSVLTVRNIDLRRKVKYKPRRTQTRCGGLERAYRKDRNYDDFLRLMKQSPELPVVEMDTVEGGKGGKNGKVLLTMLFRSCSLMLIFLLEKKKQTNVLAVFDRLTEALGLELFRKLFPVILTDGGGEFQDPTSIEHDSEGNARTRVFYCNPYSSWQKGMLEKNHEYIRYVLPKGSSFNSRSQEDITLLANHINSETRDGLNGCSPMQLSRLLLDAKLHEVLNLREIAPDDVNLSSKLFKR